MLKFFARAILRRYHPRIVGITGSVGKTSTCAAVASVLGGSYRVGWSGKNYNSEIGLPLAIIGCSNPGTHNPIGWLAVFGRACARVAWRINYPEILVLEYGLDHPGDMDYLLSIAVPDVAVITSVAPVHLEFMGSQDTIVKEKGKLVQALGTSGQAIINCDESLLLEFSRNSKARVTTYGLSESAQIRAQGAALTMGSDSRALGISFRISLGGSTVPISLPGVVGAAPVRAALAAAAVAQVLGVSTLDLTQALAHVVFPAGRLRLLPGIKQTQLLDDTYNSSPEAVKVALAALCELPLASGSKRWAVLGDMLELGAETRTLHKKNGQLVASSKVDYLVAIGELGHEVIGGAIEAGLNPDHAWHFAEAGEAGKFVQDRLAQGDVVLIKGSQGMRCERVTRELMAEPMRARELLVRQYKPWV